MTSALVTAERLAAAVRDLDALGHSEGAACLRAILDEESTDAALGLSPGWQARERHRRRQEALLGILSELHMRGRAERLLQPSGACWSPSSVLDAAPPMTGQASGGMWRTT
jgi:hypothetical protein